MKLFQDAQFLLMCEVLFAALILASVIGFVLSRRVKDESQRAVVANLNARIGAWWLMVVIFLVSVAIGPIGSVVLFALMSFLALREYFALSPTLRSDHRVLLWLIFAILPLNYLLIGMRWYGLFAVFIPVYAFIGLQVRAALTGASQGFLDRTARLQ